MTTLPCLLDWFASRELGSRFTQHFPTVFSEQIAGHTPRSNSVNQA